MPRLTTDAVQEGDVLAEDIFHDQKYLFSAGTVLNIKHLQVLKKIGIPSILIENRRKRYGTPKEILPNIERRFSYVEGIPLMMLLKSWMKDILTNPEADDSER
jgi:hypothetical protein